MATTLSLQRRRGVGLAGLCLAVLLPSVVAHAHRGMHNVGANKACAQQELGDDCSWTDAEHSRYIGTCRQVSEALLCVRNQPIQRLSASATSDSQAEHELGEHSHDAHSHQGEHERGHGHTHDEARFSPSNIAGKWGPMGFVAGGLLVLFGVPWHTSRRRRQLEAQPNDPPG